MHTYLHTFSDLVRTMCLCIYTHICVCMYVDDAGDVSIVEGLTISNEVQRLIDATVQELQDEKSQLVDVLQSLL